MKVKEYKSFYQEQSKHASEVARQLAFAGIAIVWVFKLDSPDGPAISRSLVIPTAFFAIALALDFLQYLLGYIIWWMAYRHFERKYKSADYDVGGHSVYLPLPQHLTFWLKSLAVIIGYVYLGVYLQNRIFD